MRILIVFMFCVLTTPAIAGPSSCASIDADLDRLACYDREVGRTPKVVASESEGNWSVRVEKSAFEDTTDVYLSVPSAGNVPCDMFGRGNETYLLLRCSENTTAVLIRTSNCHLTSGHGGYGNVDVRLDSEPAFKIAMTESTDNRALGLWNGSQAIPFIKRMIGKETMLVRFTPFNHSPVTAEFPVSGLENVIEPLRASCGW